MPEKHGCVNYILTFTIPLTREQFERARQKLEAQSEPVKGDSGTLSAKGVKIAFSFNETTDTLAVTVQHKPFIYPDSRVESAIRDWFKETA
jgi:hypothetical protein